MQKKNERLIQQREKQRHRVGKQPMWRSKKKTLRLKTPPKEIDPDRMAFLQYLGNLEEDEAQAAQK